MVSFPIRIWAGQHALGDDVALDLVAAGVDGAGLGEQETLQPLVGLGVAGQLGARPQDAHGGLVDQDVQLGPDDLVGAGLGADLRALVQARHRVVRGQGVGLGALPGAQHGVPNGVVAVGIGLVAQVQLDELLRAALVAPASAAAALEARRGHGHVPALALVAQQVLGRHLHVVEEDLGEDLLAVDALDGAHGDARRVQGTRM